MPKFETLAPNCVGLTAGLALIHTDLFREVRSKLSGVRSAPVREIVDTVKQKFANLRQATIEERYFLPRGFDIGWFNQNQSSLMEDIVFRLDSLLEEFELELEILLVGVDDSGGHIYGIYNPGQAFCYDNFGFAAIGSGARHAEMTFVDSGFTPAFPVKEATYIAFKAKRRAERAPGVGAETDIAILKPDRQVEYLTANQLKVLDELYQREKECLGGIDIAQALQPLSIY